MPQKVEGDETGFAPCTAVSVIEILKHTSPMEGKCGGLGRSMVIGKPATLHCLRKCNSYCMSLNADTGIARNGDISSDYREAKFLLRLYKEGGTVIDVGINVMKKEN